MYINPLFNSFKVKFIIMDNLFKKLIIKDDEKKKNDKIETVNVFINLESVLMSIQREYVENELLVMDKPKLKEAYIGIISNIINLAAHYRAFFKKHKIFTNIIYYYNDFSISNRKYNNRSFIDEYRKYYHHRFESSKYETINEMIKEGLSFSNTIIDYIQKVYFVSSDRLESSCIPYYYMKENIFPSNMNIIVSKDLYDLQYVNKKCLVIYPFKENSEIITKYNVIDFLKAKYKCENDYQISSQLVPFILAVLGDKKRNLPSTPGIGFKKLYKGIVKLYEEGYIDDDDPTSLKITHIGDFIKEGGSFLHGDIKELILRNYQCIDINRQVSIAHKISLESLKDNLIDMIDKSSLRELNDKYFISNPLELEDLNNYVSDKDRNIFKLVK